MSVQLIVPAAGVGQRLGLSMPKALAMLGGRPLIAVTIQNLLPVGFDEPIIVVYTEGYKQAFEDGLEHLGVSVTLVAGGRERRDSVRRSLDALSPRTEITVIHDAARPFAPVDAVQTAIEQAREHGAATLATPVADTILVEDGAGFLESTPDRTVLWACQTPQVFQTDLIRKAHQASCNQMASSTDDATLVRRIGHPVRLVDGGAANFKITTQHDLAFAAHLLGKERT